MVNGDRQLTVDYERLKQVCLRAYRAYENGKGIFRHERTILPQYALPQDLEYDPQRMETKFPNQAGNYLWVLASMEKRSQTRQNIKNGRRVWANEETKWIFNPEKVVQRRLEDIRELLSTGFNYLIHDFPKNFLYNARVIVENFQGQASNIVHNQSVEEARKRLMELKGVGSGIANLYIIYCTDRAIASVLDPEKIRLKIDIHKSRVPTNTDAVIPSNGKVRRDVVAPILEESYLNVCREEGLNGGKLDAAIWIVGSQICVRKNHQSCLDLCPLERMCTSCVFEDDQKGNLVVYDEKGRRVETRKHVGQGELPLELEKLYPE